MGIFDFIFARNKAQKKGKLFVTSREIEKVLFQLGTLNHKQRELVKSVIVEYMGGEGVSVEEFKKHILPKLYKMVQEGKISSTDYQNLKNLLYE